MFSSCILANTVMLLGFVLLQNFLSFTTIREECDWGVKMVLREYFKDSGSTQSKHEELNNLCSSPNMQAI
jgi:hypothetical protein